MTIDKNFKIITTILTFIIIILLTFLFYKNYLPMDGDIYKPLNVGTSIDLVKYSDFNNRCPDAIHNKFDTTALSQSELKKALGGEYSEDGDYISCVFDVTLNGKEYIKFTNLEKSGVNNSRDYLFEKDTHHNTYKRLILSEDGNDYNIDNVISSYNEKELIILRHFWGGAADTYSYLNVYILGSGKVNKIIFN